ncbi:cyclase family protein [Rhodocytophaga rosea]|uniref:Cyclase family protein n=1 Tax=Rhodocytophaga rosea TaxID=2704465 RepID=A0A6C0GHE2_9BACT|nr:cyclase family protein [Rhodocytophaga rosea]QHT67234.1 cyclase family protein [Rhodocytophaga rosea]
MKRKLSWLLILSCFASVGCSTKQAAFPAGKWVDLSYDYSKETIFWPTASPFILDTVSVGMTEKGYYYSSYGFCTDEHGGTHIDAPIHFAQGGRTVDQLPLSQLIGPSVKIDVSPQALANKDYLVSIQDFTQWESVHGKIPEGSIVLLQTGYSRYWPDRLQYLGTDKTGNEGVSQLHFPGLDPKAAQWLVTQRKIKAIGIDTASIDYGQSQEFSSHVTLMKANIPAFENLASLDQVPTLGAHIVALPMKIKGGSGGPLRIIAFIPD